jgi:hypothetical protein
MKKLFVLASILIASANFAQRNLITNPGFEIVTREPTAEAELNLATGWWNCPSYCYIGASVNTPDLLSTLSTNAGYRIPNSVFTTGIPGGVPPMPLPFNNRHYVLIKPKYEYIRSRFSTPLNMFRRYRVSIWASMPIDRGSIAIGNAAQTNTMAPVFNLINSLTVRANDSCNYNKIKIPMTAVTSFTRFGEWRLFTAEFTVADVMSTKTPSINPLLDIQENLVNFRSLFEFSSDSWNFFLDNASVTELPCNLNAGFTHSVTCSATSNSLTVSVNASDANPFLGHQFNLFLMRSNNVGDTAIRAQIGQIGTATGTFAVPNNPGQFYMIKHGVWTGTGTNPGDCGWAENRTMIQIPTFNEPVNSGFSISTSLPSSGLISFTTTAGATNLENLWALFSSSVSIPSNPSAPLVGWTPVRGSSVANSLTYIQTGIQNNRYYKIMQWARHGCSTNGGVSYFVINPRFGKKAMSQDLVSTEQLIPMEEKELIDLKKEIIKK